MGRRKERDRDSLALRSAHARRRHWVDRLEAARSSGNEELARKAAKFVAEYEAFIAGLENNVTTGANKA
jgi:phage shock protein A